MILVVNDSIKNSYNKYKTIAYAFGESYLDGSINSKKQLTISIVNVYSIFQNSDHP